MERIASLSFFFKQMNVLNFMFSFLSSFFIFSLWKCSIHPFALYKYISSAPLAAAAKIAIQTAIFTLVFTDRCERDDGSTQILLLAKQRTDRESESLDDVFN